jgi:betaine-aldehyde dehydrogenase
MEIKLNYIDGKWMAALSGKTRETINPADGGVIAVMAEGGKADVDLAVAAAKKAFFETGEWRRATAGTRSDMLYHIAMEMDACRAELAMADTLDNGKPLRESEGDIDDAINCFKYYSGIIKAPYGGVYDVSDGFGPMHSYTIHEPVGVCGQITPWNYPLLMSVWKLAPALAAGNCVVFKPSSNCPLSTHMLFEIFDRCGLPAGTVNLVMGPGGEVGETIASHDDVDMVTFTGSTEVGQSIARAAVGNLKRVGLELGGKSPNVIFADADFEGAVEWAMIGIFFNQGQVCSAGSRIIIEESLKERFVARLAQRANAMTIGPGVENPDMGPLVSEAQMNKVLKMIELGKAEGATCVCGGERYIEGEGAKGYFVRPTIFDNCTPDMTIVKKEIFGPVVTIQTFKTEEEAVALANDTEFGLAGAVFTADGARALRVIKEIRAGITWINCYNPTFNEAPWGGYKKSGYGRELGIHGLEEYQEIKQVNIALQPGAIGWYEER